MKLGICCLATLMLVVIFGVSVYGEMDRAPRVGVSLSGLGAVGKVFGSWPPLTTKSKGWKWMSNWEDEVKKIKDAVKLRNEVNKQFKTQETLDHTVIEELKGLTGLTKEGTIALGNKKLKELAQENLESVVKHGRKLRPTGRSNHPASSGDNGEEY